MKKISIYVVLLLSVLSGILSSCEQTEIYKELKVDTTFQKVYIECFTNAKSDECTKINDTLASLKSFYGDKLVAVSFYAGAGAEPDVEDGFNDYRTTFGTFLYEKLGVTSTPTVYINGIEVKENLETAVAKAVKNITPTTISISTCEFSEDTGELTIAGSAASSYTTGNVLRIQAGIIENGLVSSQMVNGSIVTDYSHDNVFRGTLISIDDNNVLSNGKASFNQTITLDGYINVLNSQVVVYVVEVNGNNDGSDKIVQAIGQDITIKSEDDPTKPPTFYKKVLLEEHTGHKCPNCYNGAVEASRLLTKYGDKLSMIAVHAGKFAAPAGGGFTLDLRCDIGNAYYTTFGNPAQPSGIINRKLWEGNEYVCDVNSWDSRIQASLDEELQAGIVVKSTYNEATRKVSANITVYPQVKLEGTYKITVLITENEIIGIQQNGGSVIQPYTFNHVLRGSMNGAWGSDIITGSAEAGKSIVKNFSMSLDNTWIPENCHVVALLSKVIIGRVAPEVIQVEEIKVK